MLPHSKIFLATASYLLSGYGTTAGKLLPGGVSAITFLSSIRKIKFEGHGLTFMATLCRIALPDEGDA